MDSSTIQLFIAWCAIAVEGAVIALIIRSGKVSRLPFTTSFLCANVAAHLILNIARASHPYFYMCGYYAWAFLQSILRLLILVDVVRSFPSARFMGRSLPLLIFALAGFLGLGAGCASMMAHVSAHDADSRVLYNSALLLDRAVNIAVTVFCVISVALAKRLSLLWSNRGVILCNGLLASVGGTMLATYLYTVLPKSGLLVAQSLGAACVITGTSLWGFAAKAREYSAEPPLLPNDPFLLRLRQMLAAKVGQTT